VPIRPAPVARANVPPHQELHRSLGNQGLQRLLHARAVQAKLHISQPNDPYEQEADRVADRVMRMPVPDGRKETPCAACAGGGPTCPACAAKNPLVQRRVNAPDPANLDAPAPDSLLQALGAGRPLDSQTRAFMERRFGHDFGQVRIHAEERAAESAQAVNAAAYTVGRDLVFGAGEYSPHSRAGRQLIAHELAHVIQQAGGAASGNPVSGRGAHLAPLASGANHTIQRQPRRGRATRSASRGPAVVEDRQGVSAGQMHRSEFLATLREALLEATDAEFRHFGRTARDCPYILRTIERYATRPLSSMMRLIRAFARPPAGADARGLISAVTARARVVARRIGERQGPRAQAVTESRGATLPSHDPATIRAQLGNGRALDGHTRQKMEGSFGTSFASVRIHEDATAARFNTALGARAFTVGQDIAFAAGQYRPGTPPGDLVIAHELAHTVQQGSGMPRTSSGPADQDLERQAERAAVAAVAGHDRGAASLRRDENGMRIQRLPAVVAGGILLAEATPEAIVIAEVATVSTEVVVADGALVVAADVAAPTLLEVAAPTVLETAAPVLESTLPAALESTAPAVLETATTSSALSTTAATVGVGVAATTLSSDSPQEEQQQPCQGPTGLTPFDPIPITWFKVWQLDYYPTPIEIGGHYYDRDDPNQHLPLGEPIGVSPLFTPYVGKTMQLDPIERGPGAYRYRAVLARYGFDWSGLQADHVQDLQWSGMDDFSNLWPMDASANLSAGPRQNDHQVVTFCQTRRGPLRTMSLRQMKSAAALSSQYFGRWFVISNFQR